MTAPAEKGLTAHLIPAACLAFALFFLLPSTLYGGGGASTELQYWDFLLVAVSLGAIMTFVLAVADIATGGRVLSSVYLAAAIALVVKAILLPSNVPILDGEATFAPMFSRQGLYSVVTILLAIGVAAFVVAKFGQRAAGLLLAVILALGFQPLLQAENRRYTPATAEPQQVKGKAFFEFSKTQNNILIILMDAFQADVFAEIVEEDPELAKQFAGFTLFGNTVSVGPSTLFALMPIYSGRRYGQGSIRDFYKTVREDSIFRDFEQAGYRTALAGPYYFGTCPAEECYAESRLVHIKSLGRSSSKYIEFLDYALLRIAPTSLQGWIYNGSKGRLRGLVHAVSSVEVSVAVLDNFAETMTDTGAVPTFKFLHLMTTHAPIIVNKDCRVISEQKLKRTYYKDQAYCAVRGVAKLLAAMRALGVYDNTTVVLLADHGTTLRGDPPQRMFLGKVRPHSNKTGGRFNALFAVKPKGATAPLEVSTAPLLSSDLRATLCSLLITCPPDPRGLNAFAVPPDMPRERTFYDSDIWAQQEAQKNDSVPQDAFLRYTIGGSPDDLAKTYDRNRRPLLPGP